MELTIAFIAGVVIAGLVMIPVGRIAAGRVERRVRGAEVRARRAERLAELGSMTRGLAHEIKNPLSTVLLNAQLVREGVVDTPMDDEERDRMLRRIDALTRECERLRGILEDFLRFAGRMHLERESVDLADLLDEMSDFFLPQCVQAGVTLRTQHPDRTVPASVDPGLFKQMLLNLMINAVQAMESHDGEHELMLRLDPPATDDPERIIRLHVIDTGPGIEPDRIEEIFHPYVSAKRGGSGLGLPTARRIAEEHGGHLVAFSEPGRGSDFVIEIPADAVTIADAGDSATAAAAS